VNGCDTIEQKKVSQAPAENTNEISFFIERSHKNIFLKEHSPTFLYAKQRGFSEETIKKFQIGACFKVGNHFGLVLPIFKPNPYCQTRWIQWTPEKSFSKYQNPTGSKPTHALFSEGSDICLVFESLIDAMLVHAHTGYSSIAAMGASLKDQVLHPFKRIYLVPDQDHAGKRCFGLSGKYEKISLPSDYKDIGELILKKGAGVAKYFIEKLVSSKQRQKSEPTLLHQCSEVLETFSDLV